jgi:hypothetical protein
MLLLSLQSEAKVTCTTYLYHKTCKQVCQCRECTDGKETWGCDELYCVPVHCHEEDEDPPYRPWSYPQSLESSGPDITWLDKYLSHELPTPEDSP